MLEGLMQNDFQLTVGAMRRRLRSCYPHQEVVTLEAEGPVRASYAQVADSATSSSTWRCRPTGPSCTP
jgi:hypothetical protein